MDSPVPAEPAILRSIEIEAFRGFRERREIALGSSAIVVSGPNGTGKTSLFDALQWVLIGDLPRLSAYAGRHSFDVIVNRWSTGPASVSVEMLVADSPVRVSRKGNQEQSLLEWHGSDGVLRGAEAERRLSAALLGRADVPVLDVLLNSGLLQQEAIRLLLEADPAERFRHLAGLMGLDDLSRFTDAAKRRSDALGKGAADLRREAQGVKDEVIAAQAAAEATRAEITSQPGVEPARHELTDALAKAGDLFALTSPIPVDGSGTTVLVGALEEIVSRCAGLIARDNELSRQEARLTVDEPPEISEEQLTELRNALNAAQGDEKTQRDALDQERLRLGQVEDLASRAIPLLGETCPICRQEINRDDVASHLREIVGSNQARIDELAASVERATAKVAHLRAQEQSAEEARGRVVERREAAGRLKSARQAWIAEASELSKEPLRAGPPPEEMPATRSWLERVRVAAEAMLSPAIEYRHALSASALNRRLERQRAQVEETQVRLHDAEALAAAQSSRAEQAKLLTAASARAAASVAESRLKQVQPLVDDVFARLDPHPAFTRLEVRLADYYRKGVAETITMDEAEGVEAEPLLVFSSSQANVAALTWFLALSWSAGPSALPFLLLDDPLQSLDDVNVLGFADLCRRLRSRRQLIVSTHEPRLARLLERKLSPREPGPTTRHLHFSAWDRSGPVVESADVPSQALEGRFHLVAAS